MRESKFAFPRNLTSGANRAFKSPLLHPFSPSSFLHRQQRLIFLQRQAVYVAHVAIRDFCQPLPRNMKNGPMSGTRSRKMRVGNLVIGWKLISLEPWGIAKTSLWNARVSEFEIRVSWSGFRKQRWASISRDPNQYWEKLLNAQDNF